MINPERIQKLKDDIQYIRANARYLQHVEAHNGCLTWLFLVSTHYNVLNLFMEPNRIIPEEYRPRLEDATEPEMAFLLGALLGISTTISALTYWGWTQEARDTLKSCDIYLSEVDSTDPAGLIRLEQDIARLTMLVLLRKEQKNEESNNARPWLYDWTTAQLLYAQAPKTLIFSTVAAIGVDLLERMNELSVDHPGI